MRYIIIEADWLLLAFLCNSGNSGEIDFTDTENIKLFSMTAKNPRPKPITTLTE